MRERDFTLYYRVLEDEDAKYLNEIQEEGSIPEKVFDYLHATYSLLNWLVYDDCGAPLEYHPMTIHHWHDFAEEDVQGFFWLWMYRGYPDTFIKNWLKLGEHPQIPSHFSVLPQPGETPTVIDK